MKTFDQWLHETKGRPISNLTDEEIGRYATEYGTARASEHPFTFPKLMEGIASGTVVLFYAESKGTVVRQGSADPLGFYAETWSMRGFRDYEGELTLSNPLITEDK